MGLRYTYNKELIVKDFCEIVSRRLFITRTDLKRKICGKTAKKYFFATEEFHEDLFLYDK